MKRGFLDRTTEMCDSQDRRFVMPDHCLTSIGMVDPLYMSIGKLGRQVMTSAMLPDRLAMSVEKSDQLETTEILNLARIIAT